MSGLGHFKELASLICSLPVELQQLVCLRAMKSNRDFIPNRAFEDALAIRKDPLFSPLTQEQRALIINDIDLCHFEFHNKSSMS